MGDVDDEGDCAWVGAGVPEDSPYLLLNFAVNMKLLSKFINLFNYKITESLDDVNSLQR